MIWSKIQTSVCVSWFSVNSIVQIAFLNSIEPTVQFTKETESDGVLAFLDVKLTRENTGYLDYTVYRKPTHTDRYLNFRSDHPLQHKKTVIIKTLLCRAERLTSSEANYKE